MFSVCRKMALECFYIPELYFCHWTGVHEGLSLLALKVFRGLFLLGENVAWRRIQNGWGNGMEEGYGKDRRAFGESQRSRKI